jgi:NADPH:quinone reductase
MASSAGVRARVIGVAEYGGAEVLRPEEVELAAPGAGEALVAVRRIGVNFMDVATRRGHNPTAAPPLVPGVEGTGVIEALGDGVEDLEVGQRVAWYYVPGSYADRLIAPADALVPVPDEVDDDLAAALLMQGLTAKHLAELGEPGVPALVHSAAGGVGSLLTQLLTAAGTPVVARVSSPEKADSARRSGARDVIVDRSGSFAAEVRELTEGAGVGVVFDGAGAETYADSIESLAPHGVYAYYGGADDQPSPVVLAELPNSISVTHPVVMHHVPTRERLLAESAALFAAAGAGEVAVTIGGRYGLDEVADAHRALESRGTVGKLLLQP